MMGEWELTPKEKSWIRKMVCLLDPHHSADRDVMMLYFGGKAAQRKLMEWLEKRAMYFEGNIVGQGNLLILAEDWLEVKDG